MAIAAPIKPPEEEAAAAPAPPVEEKPAPAPAEAKVEEKLAAPAEEKKPEVKLEGEVAALLEKLPPDVLSPEERAILAAAAPKSFEEVRSAITRRERGVLKTVARFNGGNMRLAKDYIHTAGISVSLAVRDVIMKKHKNIARRNAWYAGLSVGLTATWGAVRYLLSAYEKYKRPEMRELLVAKPENLVPFAKYIAVFFTPVAAEVKKEYVKKYGVEDIDKLIMEDFVHLVKNTGEYAKARRSRIGVTVAA